MDSVHLAKDRDNQLALVNTVIILSVPQMSGDSWVAESLVASQQTSSMG
jgi:hypothetical protein